MAPVTGPVGRLCNQSGHQRRSSFQCRANPGSPYYDPSLNQPTLFIRQHQPILPAIRERDEDITEERAVRRRTEETNQVERENSNNDETVIESTNNDEDENQEDLVETDGLPPTHNIAGDTSETPLERDNVGRMEMECPFCHSIMWMKEKLSNSSLINPRFGMCCNKGDFTTQPLQPTHPAIRKLLSGSDPISNEFKRNIRVYNARFNFTSLGVKFDNSVLDGRGPYTFRIHGGIYHNIGSLLQ